MKKPLIILTGPTSVGKTDLSIRLAKAINGEIISADSMQVYKYMDIGSAKVTKEEMDGVRHHLVDVLNPWDTFNVTVFQRLAKAAMEEIYEAGHIPVVAGGTGFYIQALLYDIDFTEHGGDDSIRRELEELAQEKGASYLHQLLAVVDEESARAIHENNVKRVIRAIEYFRQTGNKISVHNQEEQQKVSPYDFHYYVLNMDRSMLYERIDKRVDLMMEQGLVDEVKKLSQMGCRRDLVSMQGLGYKEILSYLEGECTLEEAVYVLKRDTRHFAKRQLTWFKREECVNWLDLSMFHYDRQQVLQYLLKDLETVKENE